VQTLEGEIEVLSGNTRHGPACSDLARPRRTEHKCYTEAAGVEVD